MEELQSVETGGKKPKEAELTGVKVQLQYRDMDEGLSWVESQPISEVRTGNTVGKDGSKSVF